MARGEQYDAELLEHGDRRNVVDRYRYWTLEAIVADLDPRRHDFHVAIENWQHDFNIGTIVRTANAFLAAEVHIVGNRRWNRRGAMVTDRYQHVRHHPTRGRPRGVPPRAEAAGATARHRQPARASAHLETMTMPRRVCFLFGQEGPGLSEAAREVCDGTFSIAQFGSTRSINASAAAAIAMHAWIRAVRRPLRRRRLAGLTLLVVRLQPVPARLFTCSRLFARPVRQAGLMPDDARRFAAAARGRRLGRTGSASGRRRPRRRRYDVPLRAARTLPRPSRQAATRRRGWVAQRRTTAAAPRAGRRRGSVAADPRAPAPARALLVTQNARRYADSAGSSTGRRARRRGRVAVLGAICPEARSRGRATRRPQRR